MDNFPDFNSIETIETEPAIGKTPQILPIESFRCSRLILPGNGRDGLALKKLGTKQWNKSGSRSTTCHFCGFFREQAP